MTVNSSIKNLTLSGINIKSTDGYKNDNGTDPEGTFTAYANVYNVIDAALDVTVKGCFDKCIAACKENGRFPKLMAQHEHGKAPIGVITDMWSDDYGLMVKCQLCLDTQMGREYHSLIKMKALDTMSIGYYIDEAEKRQYNGYELQYLLDLDVFEVSVVSFACNDYSRIQDVKCQVKPINEVQEFVEEGKEMRYGDIKTLEELPKNYKARDCGVKNLQGLSFDDVSCSLCREILKIVGHDSFYLYEVYEEYCVVNAWDFVENEYKGLRAEYTIDEEQHVVVTKYEWGIFEYVHQPLFTAYVEEDKLAQVKSDELEEAEIKAEEIEAEATEQITEIEPEEQEPEHEAEVEKQEEEQQAEVKEFDFSSINVKSWFE